MTRSDRVLPGGFVAAPTREALLCSLDDKPRIEVANAAEQLSYIEYLLSRPIEQIRESHVLEFHKLAIQKIYDCGGAYRTPAHDVELSGGGATDVPPEAAEVRGHIANALDEINTGLRVMRETSDDTARMRTALSLSAFALWRFNWIHPFRGGNGRTARAVAYLILCFDFGWTLPGTPSWPTIIYKRNRAYIRGIRDADAADARGERDLVRMEYLVQTAVITQLKGVLKKARSRVRQLREATRQRRARNRSAQRRAARRRGRRRR